MSDRSLRGGARRCKACGNGAMRRAEGVSRMQQTQVGEEGGFCRVSRVSGGFVLIKRALANSPDLVQAQVPLDVFCKLNSVSRFARVYTRERRRGNGRVSDKSTRGARSRTRARGCRTGCRLTGHDEVLANDLLLVLVRLHPHDGAVRRGVRGEDDEVVPRDSERYCAPTPRRQPYAHCEQSHRCSPSMVTSRLSWRT